MKIPLAALAPWGLLAALSAASAADWISAPSYFTHDPETGERVRQYAPIGPFYVYVRPDYMESGYRHTRSSIQAGGSADHLHIVEEWGRPVRPYGEWRFPYRPYSVPYDLWGPPYPPSWGYGAYPYSSGAGYGGPGYPGYGFGREAASPPWHEGRYELYDRGGHRRLPPGPYAGMPHRRAGHAGHAPGHHAPGHPDAPHPDPPDEGD